MNSKKILSVFLVLLMTLSLVACNSKKNNIANNDNETIVQETQTKQEEVATTEEVSKEEATIVVQEETKEEVKEESKEKDRSNYSYWVNFLNPDGSVIERKAYKYGETPIYPSNPTYSDNRAIYEFVGWDKKLSPVTMTQSYTAQYSVVAYIINNGGGATTTLYVPHTTFKVIDLETTLQFNTAAYPSLTASTNFLSLFTEIPTEGGTVKYTDDILKISIEGFGDFDAFVVVSDSGMYQLCISEEAVSEMAGMGVAAIFKNDINGSEEAYDSWPDSTTVLGDLRYCIIGD